MKKMNLMKIVKTLFLLVMFLLATSVMKVSAASNPSSITFGKRTALTDYMGHDVVFNYKTTSDGTVIYCLEYLKNIPANGAKLALEKEADAGVTYIIQNGYPHKKFTGDNKKDYYITQTAMWIYMGYSNGGLGSIKNELGKNNTAMYKAVNSLVNGAKEAKANGYAVSSIKLNVNNSNLTLSSDGKYYVSEEIGVSTINVTGNYKVTLVNAPKNTIVTTVNGKETNEFSVNTKFIVKVPVDSISNLSTSFSIKVDTNASVEKTYIYKMNDNSYQRMVPAVTYPVTKALSATTNLIVKKDEVVVNKIDSETHKNIAGATLAIKDSNGKVVETWVSTTKAHTISNLAKGTYTLYEVKAPNGYEKTDKTYKIEITNTGKSQTITVENTELVHTSQVEISKQDVTTNKELPGAKLTVKDSKGKVVETWISTNEPHYLTLEVGKYTLIEEIAPDGYILSKEEIKFEIKKDTKETVKVVMYNTPEQKPEEPKKEEVVEVPKTDVNSTIFYTLTASISALGYGLMKKFGKR